MSKKVDERVVEMRFDNKQFESGVQTSMSTLDKLKHKLQMKDAAKGFDDLEKAAKKVDLSYMRKAAETVSMKFSAMQVAGITAISNITNSAMNAGKNIAKALTIEPVMTGFQEYETQMGAIQTILANTQKEGTTVEKVNAALDELNLYADQTVYNFTEMTRNIGTFTAAGVKLKDSVSAIKGIANLAAVSGSTSQQASTAMYQLSQALAAGKVTLMDWNSVVNAGMGGQVFQDALIRTSEHLKTGAKQAIATYGTFRESLTKGEWLTNEVLTETLTQLSGAYSEADLIAQGYTEEQAKEIAKLAETAKAAATDMKTFTQLWDTMKESVQSGWATTWRTIVGDFEEAKSFLGDVSSRIGKIIEDSSNARNTMLKEGLSSGWKQLMDAGIPDEEGYKEVFKSIAKEHGTAIDEMMKAEQKLSKEQNGKILKDSEAFQRALKKGFTEGTISADMLSESVHKMADNITNMSVEEQKAAGYTSEHVEQIKALSSGLKDGSISMDEFVKKLTRSSGRENIIQSLWNSFDGLMNIITPISEAFREIFPRTTGEQLYDITVKIENITAKFKELTEKNAPQLKATFKGIFSILKIGVTIIKSIIGGITTLIGKLTGLSGGILDITGSLGNWVSGMAKGINETNLFGKAIDGVVGFISSAIDMIKEFTGAVKEKVTASGFEWFFNLMKGIGNVIQRVGSAVGKIAAAIGGALANAFRNGDIKSLLDILNGGIFATILLSIVDKIKYVLGSVEDSLKSWQQNLQSGTIKNIAIAIGILAASLWVLSGIDSDKMGTALGGIGVLMGELMGAMWLFTKINANAKSALKGIPALIGITAAIFILASALKKISDLDWKQLGVGLTGIAGLMIILIGTAKILSTEDEKKIQIGAMRMVIMAVALKILASVCKDLSELNWEQLGKGVSGITGILIAFAGFQALMKKIQPENMLRSATSLILIGVAMELLADVSAKFGKMKWGDLGKAGSAIAGILVIAAGFGKLSSYAGKMFSSSVALILIGSAMEIFADVANKFGNMDWEQLGKAGAAIAGILVLASGLVLLSVFASGMMKTVIALTIMAAAMEIFADVANKFGNMDWEQLGKAGAAIGGILALAVGFSLLAGLSSGMLSSAAALLVMAAALAVFTPIMVTLGNMSWDSIVKGLVAIAGAFAIVGIAGAVLGPLAPIIMLISGSITLLGLACLAAGAGIMMFAAGFTALAAAGAAGATSFIAALTIITVGILNLIPSIIDELTAAIVAICNVIIKSASAIGAALKELVLLAIDIMVECVPQLADGILQLLIKVMTLLVQYTPQIIDLLIDFLLDVINGLAARLPELVAALANLITTLINSLAEHVPEFVQAWINLFGAIVQGIADAIGPILDVLSNVFSKILDSVAKVLPGIADIIIAFGDAVRNALTGVAEVFEAAFGGMADVINSVGNVIEKYLNGISGVIESIGTAALNSGKGFKEMSKGIKTITDLPIVDMGASLAAVAVGIGAIRDNAKGLDKAGKGMKQISDATKLSADSFNSIASSVSAVLSAFNSIGESAESAMSAMVSAFTNAKGPMESSTSSIITACINAIKNSEGKFSNSGKALINKLIAALKSGVFQFAIVGKYLVDGFAKGITDNTFKAEAKARAMALKALDAAKKALDEHSPSKKFMKVGAFVVAGFAKGINENVGDAEEAARDMSNGVLEATQNELGIHSPSVVFDKKVGRYIVQGIADGIKKDMSAEEAAEKKAQNIVSAFQNELDKIDRGISNRNKDFDLWQLTDGETASDVAILEAQRKKLNDDLSDYNQQVKLTTDEWLTLKNNFGENDKATQEAYGKMIDAKITLAQTSSSLISIDKSIIASQEEHLENWKTINENGLKILELESSNGYIVFDAYKDSRYIETYTDNINIAKTEMDNAEKEYSDALAKYGDMNHSAVQEARKTYQEKWIKWLEEMRTLGDYKDSIFDRELQTIADNRTHRDDIISRWEAEIGDSASDKQRYLFYKNMYDTETVEAWKEYRINLKKYENFVKDLAEKNNITYEEAERTKEAVDLYNNEVYPAQTKAIEAEKKVSNHRKEYLEQQKEDLKEQYETASDIADLKYQIWEKTSGRKATDAEKENMKLAFLTQQLEAQAKLVEMAKTAWEKAKSDEKQKYEKEYLNAQLELANLQSEVLDIQEENIKRQERALDRQRSAQNEYNDYIKKYEKYYLEHGMTREELEKDAKLVSGYDPNKTVTTMITETKNAMGNLQSNNQYNGLLSNFSEMGTSYATAVSNGIQNGISLVTDSTTTMLETCTDAIDKSKESWTKAGVVLVVSFISGIQSKIQDAVQAGFELASKTLEAMLSVIDSDMDYSPTITPVLDMSNVSSGVSKLNSMLTGNTSLGLAKSISSVTKARGDLYADKLAEGNGPRNVYEITQNNYSPKAISSIELYRKTNNLMSRYGKKVTQ